MIDYFDFLVKGFGFKKVLIQNLDSSVLEEYGKELLEKICHKE